MIFNDIMRKIILVTGGNRGIGLEICKQLCEKGHEVIMGSRNVKDGEEKAKEIDGKIFVQKLDVTDGQDIDNVVKYIQKEFGHLDVLINNAGISFGRKGTFDIDLQDVKKIMETNFYGAWKISQAMIPLLKNSNEGRIINISSGMGALDDLANGNYAGYRLSKSGLNGLTIMMANELKSKNIKVNAMCPGWVRTDMGGNAAPRSVEQGADTAVWMATEEKIPTGKFFRDRKEIDW
jgi:NAD(P)-dependent dehydrogenase (short-subunit alcohol dehydrogenase family)